MLSKASVNHNSHLELNKEMRFDEVKYIHEKKKPLLKYVYQFSLHV